MSNLNFKAVAPVVIQIVSAIDDGVTFTTDLVAQAAASLLGQPSPAPIGPQSTGVWGDIRHAVQDVLYLLSWGSRSGMGGASGFSCPVVRNDKESKRGYAEYGIECRSDEALVTRRIAERTRKRDLLAPFWTRKRANGVAVKSTFVKGPQPKR